MPLEFVKQTKSIKERLHDGEALLLDKFRGPMVDRSHKVLHVSDLTNGEKQFCAREFALMDASGVRDRMRRLFPAMRIAFEVGKMYEDLVRNEWLVDHAVGYWRCGVCNRMEDGPRFGKRPKHQCFACDFEMWRYQEVPFVHAESKASGSPDLLLDVGRDKHLVYELKTIDKDEFKALKMPYAEHRIRTQCYLRLIQQSSLGSRIHTDSGRILYMCKGFGAKSEKHGQISPFREFTIEADHAAADKYLADGVPLALWRDGGPMPVRLCANVLVPRSQQCKMHEQCWSNKYPPGMKNDNPVEKTV